LDDNRARAGPPPPEELRVTRRHATTEPDPQEGCVKHHEEASFRLL
jgi:hypothetical protein